MNDDRRAQIVRLLKSRDDGLPTITRNAQTEPGFAHGVPHRFTCDDCFGEDPARKMCPTCHGRGYTERRVVRDPYATDKVTPYGLDGSRHERTRARDAEIARLGRQLAPPKSEADLTAETGPFLWERERKRLYSDYDFAALDAALERLRDNDPAAAHALHSVFVYGYIEASTVLEATLERGLRFLDDRLPTPLRAPEEHPAVQRIAKKAAKQKEAA